MGTSDVDTSGGLRRALIQRFGRENLRASLKRFGFDATHWVRVAAYQQVGAWLDEIGPESLDTLEIAPGHHWQDLPFRSYRSVEFPDFDICRDVLPDRFDLIIADQVFEHVRTPWKAARNVRAMLGGGIFSSYRAFSA